MILCKNCHQPLGKKYCPNCGQKSNMQPITLPHLIRELPEAVFHIDKGFLYNIIQLIKRPGYAITDYLEGKRKPFFHPASFLVISLVLNYLVVKITDLHFYDEAELLTMDPVTAKAIKDYDILQWWFLEHTYLYILMGIPASSLFLYLVFKLVKRKFNIAETSVIALFTIAQGVLNQTFIYLLFGWNKSGAFMRTVESINGILLIIYASYVICQLLTTVHNKYKKGTIALLTGMGLLAIWLGSAYLLYWMME
jgi:hypothetical protein